MLLKLGVENVAYADPEAKGETTTGEVAQKLEDRYHVMGTFVQIHEADIGAWVAKSMADNIEAMEHKEHISEVILGDAMGKIENAFRQYLDADVWQKVTGQVIAAAQNGVSYRFKNAQNQTISAKKKRGARPAFINTGLYQSSFRAEIK